MSPLGGNRKERGSHVKGRLAKLFGWQYGILLDEVRSNLPLDPCAERVHWNAMLQGLFSNRVALNL